jgi:arylsulfatase
MKALERNGLTEKTLIVFTSDNDPWLSYGDHAGSAGPLREGKGTCWEGGTRVPCVMRWPGHLPAGTKSSDMVMTIDLLPTLAKLIGAKLPGHKIDGLDVWPLLAGVKEAANPHEAYAFYYEQNQLQAVVSADGRWKLQLPHAYRSLSGRPGGTGGIPVNYEQKKLEQLELYDLQSDLGETKDLAAANPEVVQRLTAFAETMRADLGDSLRKITGAGVREPDRVGPPK